MLRSVNAVQNCNDAPCANEDKKMSIFHIKGFDFKLAKVAGYDTLLSD